MQRSSDLVPRLLEVIERDIAPLTRAGVARGDKIFGAAVLRKSDLSLVVAGTNEETKCPLWHGEVVAIRRFYELAPAERPAPADCLFVSTHEPCSLCLSAITWAGFDNFYYLFSYQDSRDDFDIPHDLRILEQVFGCSGGAYRSMNEYWQGHHIVDLVEEIGDAVRLASQDSIDRLRELYSELSEVYQKSKSSAGIPLA